MSTQVLERTAEQVQADEECLQRVQAGIAWLQRTYGDGWKDKIDLELFSLRSGSACVLGQVYSNYATEMVNGYTWAVNNFTSDLEDGGVALGFTGDLAISGDDWENLEEAWLRQLQ